MVPPVDPGAIQIVHRLRLILVLQNIADILHLSFQPTLPLHYLFSQIRSDLMLEKWIWG